MVPLGASAPLTITDRLEPDQQYLRDCLGRVPRSIGIRRGNRYSNWCDRQSDCRELNSILVYESRRLCAVLATVVPGPSDRQVLAYVTTYLVTYGLRFAQPSLSSNVP